MKIGQTEISALADTQLVANYNHIVGIETKRLEASLHKKFKNMEFPPANTELKDALINEIKKRNIVIKINDIPDIWQ